MLTVSNAHLGKLDFPGVFSGELSSTDYVADSGSVHKKQTLYLSLGKDGRLYLAFPSRPVAPAGRQSGRYPLGGE